MVTAYNGRMRKAPDSSIEWPDNVTRARAIQEALRTQVVCEDRLGPCLLYTSDAADDFAVV